MWPCEVHRLYLHGGDNYKILQNATDQWWKSGGKEYVTDNGHLQAFYLDEPKGHCVKIF